MATTYEIVQAIQQAAANAYDGALDDKGEPLKIGLKREIILKRAIKNKSSVFQKKYCIHF